MILFGGHFGTLRYPFNRKVRGACIKNFTCKYFLECPINLAADWISFQEYVPLLLLVSSSIFYSKNLQILRHSVGLLSLFSLVVVMLFILYFFAACFSGNFYEVITGYETSWGWDVLVQSSRRLPISFVGKRCPQKMYDLKVCSFY